MERAFALSSPPFLPKLPSPNPNFRFSILPPPNLTHSISSSPFSKSPSSPLRFGTWISPNRTPQNRLSTQATSVPENAGEESELNVSFIQARSVPEIVGEDSEPNSRFIDSVKLGFLIGFWYSVNIYFNIVNKQILNVYPFPVTISALQFAVGTVLSLLMWTFNIYKKPRISTSQLVAIFPLAVGHALGNIFTNMSLVKVAVSFTQTIKSMEPFFTVVLSALYLGVMPTFWVVSSLVPIVGGVVLASATEASFDWAGFWSAMISNLTNQSRNVFSKKLMANKEESLDNITLFSIITIMSFFVTLPVTLFMEGVKFTPAYMQSAGFNVKEISMQCLLGGILYHAYQQIAYMILQKVSPVTHAVSNSVKRVVIIVASVLFFRTAVSPINALGTVVALLGVFLYSRATQIKPKPKVM